MSSTGSPAVRTHPLFSPGQAIRGMLAAAAFATATFAAPAASLPILVARGEGVAVETVPVPPDREITIARPDLVTVLLPFGVGQSGDLVPTARRTGSLRARVAAGALHVAIQQPGGTWRDLPAVPLADLHALAMRVSVTGAGGFRKVFRIAPGGAVGDDPGPAIDMFQGRIPLAAGDFAITTEVTKPVARAGVAGEARLTFTDGLIFTDVTNSEGRTGRFAVDLGAGATVVARGFLPKGVAVEPLEGLEHSERGTRKVAGAMAGVGGDVASFLGVAPIGALRLGDLRVGDVTVNVMRDLPPLGGGPLMGILGIDVLGRAERLRLVRRGDGAGVMTFAESAPPPAAGAPAAAGRATTGGIIEIPFTLVAKHLLVRAALDDTPVSLVVDTGARISLVPSGLARRARLAPAGGEGRELRGLDGRPLAAEPVVVRRLALGGGSVDNVVVHAAELPVIASLGLEPDSGLLGNDVLFLSGSIEVDFAAGVLRLGTR